MIGTDLNLTLPSTSASMATNTALTATALEAIEDVLAMPVSPGSMLINEAIVMNGNSVTDIASIQFADGNSVQTPGSMFYFEGDWYLVDAVGEIKLTDAGQLNAASVGGIQGDYGGVNPAALSYEDSSGQYIFTEDVGVYADVHCDDLILEGDNGSVQFNVDTALTGARNFNIKSLPTSGKSLLVFDAATETLEDNGVTRATNVVYVTDIDVSGTATAATFKHGDVSMALGTHNGQFTTLGAGNPSMSPYQFSWAASTSAGSWSQLLPLRAGDELKTLIVTLTKQNTTATVVTVYKNTTVVETLSYAVAGTHTITLTVASPVVAAAGETWWVQIDLPFKASGAEYITAPYITFNRP